MPHVSFLQVENSVSRVAQEWEKTPQFANQLCRVLKYEKDRRKGDSRSVFVPQPQDIEPAVWTVWSRWLSGYGLEKAIEAAEMLSDRLFPKGGKSEDYRVQCKETGREDYGDPGCSVCL